MKLQGKITKILEVESGTSKAGKPWQKQTFVIDTGDQYDNVIAFEVFGDEKVDNLTKYNKIGDEVSVEFNIKCNEWKDRYFTSLQSWRIDKVKEEVEQVTTVESEPQSDLPF